MPRLPDQTNQTSAPPEIDPLRNQNSSSPEITEPKTIASKSRRFLRELIMVIVSAVLLVILVKTFLAQAFYIPSPSMAPTLSINDRVMVSKIAYTFDDPGVGDVVVFRDPNAPPREESFVERIRRNVVESVGLASENSHDLIKRVIAVEGDLVSISNNQVYVNGVPLEEPYLQPGYSMSDFGTVQIPKDHIWVMGDNRNNSQDSRRKGPIPVDSIIGRAFLRFWPFDRLAGL